MLNVGDRAPAFEAEVEDGTTFRLSDHLGQRHVVLYFYIKDFTKG